MSSNTEESSISAVPIELIHVIFSYLPRASRRSFASLSHSIHWVLQPKLFEHTTLTLLEDNANDAELLWISQKMEFLTSERIAPAVSFLRVTGASSRFGIYGAQLLESFLHILPNLQNLRVLHLSRINLFHFQLTKKLAVISGRVEEIVVRACEFHLAEACSERVALPFKYVRVRDDGGAWINSPGVCWWWSPKNLHMPLHTLVLENLSSARHLLGKPLPPMPSLKDLSVPVDAILWTTLCESLVESCKGLEALRFSNISRATRYLNIGAILDLPIDALPLLKLYEGPPELVVLLIPDRPVKHLILNALTDDKVLYLAQVFAQMGNAHQFESLHLDLDSVNDRVLEFTSTFRNLRALSISVDSNIVHSSTYQPIDVVSSIMAQSPSHTLSPRLEFFSLCAHTRPTSTKPSPLQGFNDLRYPPYLKHCHQLRYIGFSEGENGTSVQFSPRFGIWIEEPWTIETWQNQALGLYEATNYDSVPRMVS